jgi:hypothetical protein
LPPKKKKCSRNIVGKVCAAVLNISQASNKS